MPETCKAEEILTVRQAVEYLSILEDDQRIKINIEILEQGGSDKE